MWSPDPTEIAAGNTAAGNDGRAIVGWPSAASKEAMEAGMSYDTIDAGGVAVIGGKEGTTKGREMAGATLPGGGGKEDAVPLTTGRPRNCDSRG